MQCADLDESLSAYADGQATGAEKELLETHIAICRRCQGIVDRHQQTRRLLHLMTADTWAPPDMRLRIAHAVRSDRPGGQTRRPLWLASVVALVALLALSGAIIDSTRLAATSGGAAVAIAPAAPAQRASTSHRRSSARLADPTACTQVPERSMAECLGVSQRWLPTLLAEQRATNYPQHSAYQLPPTAEQSSHRDIQAGGSHTALKGGGAQSTHTPSIHGLQAM